MKDAAIQQEVRLATVLYGGVSLAIYIHGVTKELLRLVRSTTTVPGSDEHLLIPDDALGEDTERVYRKLGRMIGYSGEWKPLGGSTRQDRVRTRFVVDIISGTSAGGINGIYLAKALAQGADLDELSRLWIEEGAIDRLINDWQSEELRDLGSRRAPQSLLNSRRMFRKLMDAFDAMNAARDRAKRNAQAGAGVELAQELDLFVTTTDIRGLPIALELSDRMVHEMRHRSVFHLRHGGPPSDSDEGTGARSGPRESDFEDANNAFLAFVARCTSSFPFAFEPMTLSDIDADMARRSRWGSWRATPDDGGAWKRFFPDYHGLGAHRTVNADVAEDIAKRAFGDGGYLDNKPFSYAIDSVMRRGALLPVDRKLLYVEPAPASLAASTKGGDKPDVIENVVAALSLARQETIRDDLDRIRVRNASVERLQSVLSGVSDDLEHHRALVAQSAPLSRDEYRRTGVRELTARFGLSYGGYHRLKVSAVTDEVARYVARASGYALNSDEFACVRDLVAAWRSEWYRREPVETSGAADIAASSDGMIIETESAFLLRFDLLYRIRRLRFVLDRIDEWIHRNYADRVTHAPKELTELRRSLSALLMSLRARQAFLLEPDPLKRPEIVTKPVAELATLQVVAEVRKALAVGMSGAVAERQVRRPEVVPLFAQLDHWFREQVDGVTKPASDRALELLAAAPDWVRHTYEQYERYDHLIFPVAYATEFGEELDHVDILRISPTDANALIEESPHGRKKLAGTTLANFGAFLDRRWRHNDMMWGRLDGAERLITALLPTANPDEVRVRDELIREAHCRILREEFSAIAADPDAVSWSSRISRDQLSEWAKLPATDPVWSLFRDEFAAHYRVPRGPASAVALNSVTRATRVIGGMLDGLSDRYRALGRPATILTKVGAVAWGLVEAASPQSILGLLVRHGLKLLLLFSVALLAVGFLQKSEPVKSVGWGGVALGILIYLMLGLVREVLSRRTIVWKMITGALMLGVAGALTLGGVSMMRPQTALVIAAEAGYRDLVVALILGVAATLSVAFLGYASRSNREGSG